MHLSLPVRGAWIEISMVTPAFSAAAASLPVRGAWIDIISDEREALLAMSLPVRGAWIEIA